MATLRSLRTVQWNLSITARHIGTGDFVHSSEASFIGSVGVAYC
jgi:hypothetical protein